MSLNCQVEPIITDIKSMSLNCQAEPIITDIKSICLRISLRLRIFKGNVEVNKYSSVTSRINN